MISSGTKALCLAAATATAGFDAAALDVKGDFQSGLRAHSTAPASATQWWNSHVVRINGVMAIALGNGAFATAGHVGAPKGASDLYRVRDRRGFAADVILFRHPSHATLPHLPIVESRLEPQFPPQPWVAANPTQQGLTLPIVPWAAAGERPSFGTSARRSGDLILSTPAEGFTGGCVVQPGDSASGVFSYDSNQRSWQLAGIVVARLLPSEISPETHNFAVAVDASVAEGMGAQLLNYRDGKIRGGLADFEVMEWARHYRSRLLGGFCLVVGASGLLCAWLNIKPTARRLQESRSSTGRIEISSKSTH